MKGSPVDSKQLEKILKRATVLTSESDITNRLLEIFDGSQGSLRSSDSSLKRKGGRVMLCHASRSSVEDILKPDNSHLEEAAKKVGLPWDPAYADRSYPVWSSDERVNRAGDIDLQHWVFDNYNKNPLVLFSHEWGALPIGNSIDHHVANRVDGTYNGPGLKQTMVFATAQQSEVADSVQRLWKARFLRTVSVGFFPGKVIDVEDPADRAALGLGKWGVIMDDEELIEVSPTSVPSLPSAHNSVLGEARSLLRGTDLDVVRECVRMDASSNGCPRAAWAMIDANIRTIWKNLFPDVKAREHNDPGIPVDFNPENTRVALKEDLEVLEKRFLELQNSIALIGNRLTAVESRKAEVPGASAILDKIASDLKAIRGS